MTSFCYSSLDRIDRFCLAGEHICIVGVLAAVLKAVVKKKKGDDLLVLAIPCGGVIIAGIVAEKQNADYFDIVIPRKLTAPDNKENTIVGMSQDGSIIY
jgi:predicted phosphoribosyltransferase